MGKLFVIVVLLLCIGCSNQVRKESKSDLIPHISEQMEFAVQLAESVKDSFFVSPRTIEDGHIKLVPGKDWTSGFFAGNLWMMFEMTGNDKWKTRALEFTLPLEQEQWDGGIHDFGFKMFNSFGKVY